MINYYEIKVGLYDDNNKKVDGLIGSDLLDSKEAIDKEINLSSIEDVIAEWKPLNNKYCGHFFVSGTLLGKRFIEFDRTYIEGKCNFNWTIKIEYSETTPVLSNLLYKPVDIVNQYLSDHNLKGLHL